MATQYTAGLTTGQVLTAATLNTIGAAWETYTPTLTVFSGTNPTLGTGSSQSGFYTRINKLVVGWAIIRFGTSGAAAGSGLYRISLPVNAKRGQRVGFGQMIDASAAQIRPCQTIIDLVVGANQMVIQRLDQATTSTNVDQGSPWTWANNDELNVTFIYEAE